MYFYEILEKEPKNIYIHFSFIHMSLGSLQLLEGKIEELKWPIDNDLLTEMYEGLDRNNDMYSSHFFLWSVLLCIRSMKRKEKC